MLPHLNHNLFYQNGESPSFLAYGALEESFLSSEIGVCGDKWMTSSFRIETRINLRENYFRKSRIQQEYKFRFLISAGKQNGGKSFNPL